MGRFSTTVQIKNNIDRSSFINSFCDVMKKRGFVPCVENEAALSYALAFSEGGWVTLVNEDYRDNPKKAQDDLKYLVDGLKTSAFSVEVVDSDFAILSLNSGDTVIVGDGSGYGIEEPSRGNRKYWEPLLANGRAWEQFTEIAQKDSTFVEGTLSELAVILGISPELICAECSDLSDTENAVQLYFKKAEAKEKAMTLNAAFKQVFGEALEPLGFKLIKSKYPYFVRVVSDEIIHYVTVANETADGRGDNGVKYKCFNVFCGVSTVYNGNIDFNENHAFINSVSEIYTRTHWFDVDMKYRASIMEFYYDPTNNKSLISALKKAFVITEKHALPIVEQAVTLEKCIDYYGVMEHHMFPSLVNDIGEGLLCTKLFSADQYVMFKDKIYERELIVLGKKMCISTENKEKIETRILNVAKKREKAKKKYYEIFTDPELQAKAPAELERRKKENTEKLREYGLDI